MQKHWIVRSSNIDVIEEWTTPSHVPLPLYLGVCKWAFDHALSELPAPDVTAEDAISFLTYGKPSGSVFRQLFDCLFVRFALQMTTLFSHPSVDQSTVL